MFVSCGYFLINKVFCHFPVFPNFCFFPQEKFARKNLIYWFFKFSTLLISFKKLSKAFCSFKTQVSKYCSKLSSKQAYGLSIVLQLFGQKKFTDVNLFKSQTHMVFPTLWYSPTTKRKVLY